MAFYLPGLRDRRAAVAPLAREFLAEFAARNRPDVRGITPAALAALEAYDWPGNVRELRNVVERAVALCPGPLVQWADLTDAVRAGAGPAARERPVSPSALASCVPATLRQCQAEAETVRITEALKRHGNIRLRAAAELGISRMGLYQKLHRYGLLRGA